MKLTVGSRGSNLALAQTDEVIKKLKKTYPEVNIDLKKIKTTGDKILDTTLHEIGGKALFVKELEKALVDGEIDFAVHSMKDVPGELYDEFDIFTVLKRSEPRDVLISKNNYTLDTLPEGSVVATSSLRRKAQLLAYRNDLEIVPIRGNINTRIKKFSESSDIDAIILAKAGIDRLGLSVEISQVITTDIIVPCVGQGALGIEVLKTNTELKEKLKSIQDEKVKNCVLAERAFLKKLGGSCYVPVGAYANYINEDEITITGVVAGLSGEKVLRKTMTDSYEKAYELGQNLAADLLDKGADDILAEIEGEVD
ncbi:hydroxymethylbilane synthase [Natranaerofaba carboxydovora]|uniref:hydroxymethylbilane synthase n=1 Tax=Natranaerofaba carboxydovora TaxID=2742683 RepID=UPI001F147378|nr:hydroxymethylbilane synthase [Natranaerofaba carboxydovora]UMZ73204.1 Porphobilinogen deaminase [Natranaerofaba carboxydovora]